MTPNPIEISDITGTVALQNGVEMPYLGLGVMNIDQVVDAVGWAIEAGYRLFDTAKIRHYAIWPTEKGTRSSLPSLV